MSGLEIVAAIAALVSGFHAASELVRRLPPDTVSKLCCGFPRRGKRNALEYWLIRGEEVAIYLKEIHENRIAMYRHTHAEYDTVYTDEHMLLEYLVDVRIIIEQRIILVLRNSVNDSSDRADFKTLASIIQDADLGIIEVVEYIALVGHRNTDKYKTTISGTRIKLTKMVKVQRVGHFKLLTVPTWTKFHQYRLDFPNDYSPLTETYKPLADLSETDHTRKAKKRMQSRSQDAEMEIIPVGKLNDRSAATSAQKAYRGQSHAGSGRRKSTPDETHAPVIESALGYDKGSRGDRSYNDEPEVTPKPRYEYPNDVDDTSYHGSSKGHARSSKLSAERHGDDRKPSFCPGPIVEWDLDYDESGRHATSTQKEEEFEDRERTKTTDMSRKSASTPTVEHPSSHGRPRKSRKKERPQTLVGPSPPSHEPGRRPYKRSSAPAQSRGDNPIADVQRPSKSRNTVIKVPTATDPEHAEEAKCLPALFALIASFFDNITNASKKTVSKSSEKASSAYHKTGEKMSETYHSTGDKLGSAYHSTGEKVSSAYHVAGEKVSSAYHGTGDKLGSAYHTTTSTTRQAVTKTGDKISAGASSAKQHVFRRNRSAATPTYTSTYRAPSPQRRRSPSPVYTPPPRTPSPVYTPPTPPAASAHTGNGGDWGENVAMGAGGAAGAWAGAAAGSVFGPVGTVVGGFLGFVVGGGAAVNKYNEPPMSEAERRRREQERWRKGYGM